ncbi:MAG: nuclease [Acidimicrobiales bacterium]|nr:MAG: nuclease [Acidimicrobiales bacterium]
MSRLLPILIAAALLLGACTDDVEPVAPDVSDTPATPDTPATVPDQPSLAPNATVERVVDGDTIVADIDGRSERVRLLGIDTPESVAENRPDQCYGEEASDYLKALLPEGAAIALILDEEARDQYDRLLAYVVRSSDELFVNLDLIEQGYAGVLIYDPNDHYESLFRSAEREAVTAGVGLWTVCGGPDVPLE